MEHLWNSLMALIEHCTLADEPVFSPHVPVDAVVRAMSVAED